MIPFPTTNIAGWPADPAEQHALSATIRTHMGDRGCAVVRCQSMSSSDFEAVARLVCGELVADNGEHDRVEAGAPSVFTPTVYPANLKILWHNENSFLDVLPGRIVFGCVRAPETGGETPILDAERLVAALDPGIVARFRDRGVSYVRHYVPGLHRSWQQILRSATRQDAEEYCRSHDVEIRWAGNTPTTISVRPAFAVHPDSGRELFVAQPLHWHPRALPAATREQLLKFLGPDKLPRNCHFGDGSAIEDSIIDELMSASAELEESFPWSPGDILAVDNLRYSHARNAYQGERKLLVAMGTMLRFARPGGEGAIPLTPIA